jgi:hypothetical protein
MTGLQGSKPRPASTTPSWTERLRDLPRHAPNSNVPLDWRKVKDADTGSAINCVRWPLFLFGPVGTGKSALAGLMYCFWRGTALWINAVQGLRAVTMATSDHPEPYWGIPGAPRWSERDMWDGLDEIGREVVVLDDIGTRARASDAQFDALHRILLQRDGRPLIATSNLGLADLARVYDDRSASRLASGTVLQLDGPDQRTS